MHPCPNCSAACYCDGEDLEHADAPENCSHLCIQYADDDDYPVEDDDATRNGGEQ